MKPAIIFKVILFSALAFILFVIIAPEFHIIKMGETELVLASYLLVPVTIYGIAGLLTYKRAVTNEKSPHMIPTVAAVASFFLHVTFIEVIFLQL